MARRAVILGGTGQIGRAIGERLLRHGWAVDLVARHADGMPAALRAMGGRFVEADRRQEDALRRALAGGADLVVDCVCFGADDAAALLNVCRDVTTFVVMSSASVYADAHGRSLDTSTGPDDFPVLPVPVAEAQSTIAPGTEGYSPRKVAMERMLLDAGLNVTVVRPAAIHGAGSAFPREWHFVKRALDRRPAVILATEGRARFQTTTADNLASLVEAVAELPGARVLNCGDPASPSALEISRAIAEAMGHVRIEVLLPGPPISVGVGKSPWQAPHPVVLDMSAAAKLGYEPVTTYARAVPATCRWLVEVTRDRDWREVLPQAAGYLAPMLDYDAEDAYLASLVSDTQARSLS